MSDFIDGATKVTISAKVSARNIYTQLSKACVVSASMGSCGTPSVPTPTNFPKSSSESWSMPTNCVSAFGLNAGQEGAKILIDSHHYHTTYEKTTSGCAAGLWRIISKKQYFWWMVKSEVKLDWADAMEGLFGLRNDYPYTDGWRVVAVVPAGTESGDLTNLGGLQFKTENDYKEYLADTYGDGDGGSSASYSGESGDSNIQLHESIASIHETGGMGEGETDYTIVSLADDAVSVNADGTSSINLTDDDGISDSSRWDISMGNLSIPGGCGVTPGQYPRVFRKVSADLCSLDVYMKKVGTTTGAGVGSGNMEDPQTALDPGAGNYTATIDGGIDDRSNGQRFIGANYNDLNGFDVDGSVAYDSLYIPVNSTTRWGETLTLRDPNETYNGRTIGNAFVAGPGDFLSFDISVASITNRMSDPDTMSFIEHCKYDDVGADCIHVGTASATEINGSHVASAAFDWLDATYWEANSVDAILTWNFGYYELANSTLASATTAGDATLTLTDASNFPEEGILSIGADSVAYTSKSGNVLSGIPTDPDDDFSLLGHVLGSSCSIGVSRSGKIIKKYSIKIDSDIDTAPKNWIFQGSTDGSTWVTLDTQTNVTWTSGEEKGFSVISNSVKYKQYRLNVTDTVGGSNLRIVELGMYKADTYTVGDWVYGVMVTPSGPITRFAGVVVSKHRSLSDGNQTVTYEASGLVQRLSDLGFAFEVSFKSKTIKEMAELIAAKIPQQIVVSTEGLELLPRTVIPNIDWTCVSYKRALDMLMDYAGHFGYYITPQRVLHFVNLRYDDSTSETQARDDLRKISLAIPAEGDGLSSGDYFVMSQDLAIDVASAKTLCKVMGDYPQIELTELIPIVTSEYASDGSPLQPPYAVKVDRSSPTGEETELESTFMVVLSHNKIQTQLLSDPEKAIEVMAKYHSSTIGTVQIQSGWWEPRSNPYNFITRDQYSAFYINTFKPLTALEVTYVYKDSSPLLADTGWIGSAYSDFGVQNAILVQDFRFQKHIIRGEVVRDDSTDLLRFARQLIDPYKDWYVGGTVLLDFFHTEFGLDNFVNFSGTNQDWTLINAYPKSITFDLANLSTQLELTNNYFVGSVIDSDVRDEVKVIKDSAEVQRILNRLRSLETRENQF